jgi:1-acyl-sn-glycerol-3-phosphate acyltransferase
VGDVLEAVRRRVESGGVLVAERPGGRGGDLPPPPDGRVRTKRAPGEEQWLGQTWTKTVLRGLTRRLMWLSAYGYFGFEVRGREHLPQGAFIVASSHNSHLDTGAVVTAFGDRSHELFIMGARDYFFNKRLKGWLFHTLLNVIPFDRTENVMEGLRLAEAVLCSGRPVLIYPEGRRSATGQLQPFKPGIGLLGVELGVPIVPCCVEGSHAAMPKGSALPRPRRIRVTFAPPVTMESYRALRGTMERRELWRRVADDVRAAVERILEESRKASPQ